MSDPSPARRKFRALIRAHDPEWMLGDYSPSERRRWIARLRYRRGQWAVQDALRDWIKPYPWEWFGHLTFESCESLHYAKNAVRRFFNVLSTRAWGRNYYKRKGKGLFAFVAYERQKRGDWHAHFLAAGTRDMDQFDAMDTWQSRHGFARIYPYDPTRGGGAYATKYATKELDGDWDAIGSWRGAELPPLLRAQGEA